MAGTADILALGPRTRAGRARRAISLTLARAGRVRGPAARPRRAGSGALSAPDAVERERQRLQAGAAGGGAPPLTTTRRGRLRPGPRGLGPGGGFRRPGAGA